MQKSQSFPYRTSDPLIANAHMPAETALWRSVLAQAVRDIYDKDERVRRDALRWVLTRDFVTVCDYAFVEPDTMKTQLANLANMPLALARKYGTMLRSEIIADPA